MYKRRPLYNEYDLPEEEICKQYEEGISAYRLAKDYNVATDTILRRSGTDERCIHSEDEQKS